MFLSPFVDCGDVTFFYKQRQSNSQLNQTDFTRHPNGGVVEVSLDNLLDKHADLTPQAADMRIFGVVESTVDYFVKSAVITLTDLANEDLERRIIKTAITAAGSGSAVSFSQSTDDPIDTIDSTIEALIKSAQSQEIGVVFGVSAWRLFKANANVRAASKGDLSYAQNPSLFLGETPYMTSAAFLNTAGPGAPTAIDFVFPSSSLLVFSRASEITQADPSAMKTFRFDPALAPKPVRARFSRDGRAVIVASDWSGSPVVTNLAGFTLLNVS
jgi:hypothetical protein